MLSSSLLVSSLYNSSTYSAHLSITSSFSTKAFPCLPLIVCSPLFPFGRSSLIFWYINWLCALSNISISLHLSSEYLSLASRHSFRISFFSLLYCSSAFMFLHILLSSIISEFIQFCFFGCFSFTQISSATVTIPSFSLFQISSTSIHPSISFPCSCWSSRILYASLTSGFLRLLTFHLTVFLSFFTLCSLIFIFTTTTTGL